MTNHTQLDDKLSEADNIQVWKYKTSVILEEIDLDQYLSKKSLGARGRWGQG